MNPPSLLSARAVDGPASAAAAPAATDAAAQAELVARTLRLAPADGLHDGVVPGLRVVRASAPSLPLPSLYDPGLCVVVQGRKEAWLGEERLVYDPLHYLVASVTMPLQARIVDASVEAPYLCLRLDIDARAVGDLLSGAGAGAGEGAIAGQAAGADEDDLRALRTTPMTRALQDAFLRLLRLADEPGDLPALAPGVLREIHWRVLRGPLGSRLRAQALADTHAHRIARAIELLKHRLGETLRVEDVASAVAMSASTLHHHFKRVTGLSPLQFRQALRLHEARRAMLAEGLDAAQAGHRVGYESASQFSREYRRLFGAPPRAEVDRLRERVHVRA